MTVTAATELTTLTQHATPPIDTPVTGSVTANDTTTSGGVLSFAINDDATNGAGMGKRIDSSNRRPEDDCYGGHGAHHSDPTRHSADRHAGYGERDGERHDDFGRGSELCDQRRRHERTGGRYRHRRIPYHALRLQQRPRQ